MKERENELKDSLKQLNTTKSYAIKLENKINDLETSLGLAQQLLKAQTNSNPDVNISESKEGSSVKTTTCLSSQMNPAMQHNISLEQRISNVEFTLMQDRMNSLEKQLQQRIMQSECQLQTKIHAVEKQLSDKINVIDSLVKIGRQDGLNMQAPQSSSMQQHFSVTPESGLYHGNQHLYPIHQTPLIPSAGPLNQPSPMARYGLHPHQPQYHPVLMHHVRPQCAPAPSRPSYSGPPPMQPGLTLPRQHTPSRPSYSGPPPMQPGSTLPRQHTSQPPIPFMPKSQANNPINQGSAKHPTCNQDNRECNANFVPNSHNPSSAVPAADQDCDITQKIRSNHGETVAAALHAPNPQFSARCHVSNKLQTMSASCKQDKPGSTLPRQHTLHSSIPAMPRGQVTNLTNQGNVKHPTLKARSNHGEIVAVATDGTDLQIPARYQVPHTVQQTLGAPCKQDETAPKSAKKSRELKDDILHQTSNQTPVSAQETSSNTNFTTNSRQLHVQYNQPCRKSSFGSGELDESLHIAKGKTDPKCKQLYSDAVRSDTPKHRKRPLNDQSTNDQEKYVLPHKRAHNHYPTPNILPAWCEALCGTSTPAKRSHITSLTSGNKRNNEDSQLDHGQIINGTKHSATHHCSNSQTQNDKPYGTLKTQIFRRSLSPRSNSNQQRRSNQKSFLECGREIKERWLQQGARSKTMLKL